MKVEIREFDGPELYVNGVRIACLDIRPLGYTDGRTPDAYSEADEPTIKSRLVEALAPDVAALKAKIARLEDRCERLHEERDAIYDALVAVYQNHNEVSARVFDHLKDHGIR